MKQNKTIKNDLETIKKKIDKIETNLDLKPEPGEKFANIAIPIIFLFFIGIFIWMFIVSYDEIGKYSLFFIVFFLALAYLMVKIIKMFWFDY